MPVLGQELLCDGIGMVLGGSSADSASWLAGLGAKVDFWGKVGCDALGEFVVRELRRRGIGIRGMVKDPAIRTGVCVCLSYPDDRALISYLGSITALELADIPLDHLHHYDHLHSGSIFIQHGMRPGFADLFRAAKEAGLTTSLDSGWDPEERWEVDIPGLFPYVDIFIPNESEILHITGAETVEEATATLSPYVKTVVVKMGEEGALAREGERLWRVPAFEIEVADTTGAGDGFNAGFLYARIGQDRTLPDALRFANACGAIAVTTLGGSSAIPTTREVDVFIERKLGNSL